MPWESNRDHESNISKHRVANGYTVRELAEEIGCSQGVLSALINGMHLPYYIGGGTEQRGQLKPYVKKLVEVLHAPIDELFPRYFCDIERNAAKGLLKNQHEGLLVAEIPCPIKSVDLKLDFEPILNDLPERLRNIIYWRYWLGETLDEIGARENVCTQRARELAQKALRLLRGKVRKMKYRYP